MSTPSFCTVSCEDSSVLLVEPDDIVNRLLRVRPYWFNGNPLIRLIPGIGQRMGALEFDFGDQQVRFCVYMPRPISVYIAARVAIIGFARRAKRLHDV